MAKKKTKWQRNYESVVRAQNRAKSLIAELNAQGLQVSEYLKELVNRPLKSTRYTSKEARNYINLTRSDVIRANSKRESKKLAKSNTNKNYYTAIPYQGHQNIRNRYRYSEKIEYNPQTMYEDIAREYLKHMNYSINHASQDLARNLWRTFKIMGVKSKYKLNLKSMDKFLKGVDEGDFINAYIRVMQGNDMIKKNELKGLQNAFYGMGKSSKEAYDAATDINFEQAKITFGENNNNWNKDDVDKLYNFFKNSTAWRDFQKQMKDSDQFEELFDEISNSSLSIQQIDIILMRYKTVDEVLKEMRE